jgi:hypothetical protein
MAAHLAVVRYMQACEERNITARPHNSFEDQQMCDLLVQILDNQALSCHTTAKLKCFLASLFSQYCMAYSLPSILALSLDFFFGCGW